MTKEAQRISIAEACGWTNIRKSGPMNKLIGDQAGYKDGHGFAIPDYLNDLNAMNEVEEMLRPPHQPDFVLWLKYSEQILPQICGERVAVHASAAQRAEAFLRTINKWDDTK